MKRKSISNYPENWQEISNQIKIKAGWKCVRCGHVHDPINGYCLTVHHLDLDPSNCEWWNLPALCQRCHLYIQAKVIMEQLWMYEHSEWFKPYIAGFYAKRFNLPTNEEFVREHIDYLLSIVQVT